MKVITTNIGLRITNCRQPCLHLRIKRPSRGTAEKQQVIMNHDGFRDRPVKLTTTAPGPPTHAKQSEKKL